jgi:hypothetical protein
MYTLSGKTFRNIGNNIYCNTQVIICATVEKSIGNVVQGRFLILKGGGGKEGERNWASHLGFLLVGLCFGGSLCVVWGRRLND